MVSSSFYVSAPSPRSPSIPIRSFPSSLTTFSWRLQSKQLANAANRRGDKHLLQVLADANAPSGKGREAKEVIMVDPLEAKRLAAKQMQEIQARDKLKRQRQIEAINGAWAMIGLTAGLVVEGQTGHGILEQVAGYFAAILGFVRQ
uniref:Uncharacterized protein n=1 Tax=Amblyomma maculatum TaxID=34609 RepID=G3MSD2_AMBMU